MGGPAGTAEAGTGPGVGGLGHREGSLPAQVVAARGAGGLGGIPGPGPAGLGDVPALGPAGLSGVPAAGAGPLSHRSGPEGEIVASISGGFPMARSGGELSIDGAVSEPTEAYQQRTVGGRKKGLKSGGGNEGTELAVERGLDFFARLQFPDGHWSLHQLPPGVKLDDPALGQMESDTAATGLVLLTYLGGGYTHLDDKHRAVVRKGVDWLIKHQKPNGDLFTGGGEFTWFYSHGIAAIALCEAYGMTQDPELREPARKAIDFIVKSQNPTRGGWRCKSRRGRRPGVRDRHLGHRLAVDGA